MKVVLVNTYDNAGGAAKAAFRLHKGLQDAGVDTKMLVQTKTTDDPAVISPISRVQRGIALLRPALDEIPLFPYRNRETTIFSPQWIRDSVPEKISDLDPDVVNLHWVCHGLLQIESMARIRKAIVWTMHDSWPFTGGCHLPFDCKRYTDHCGDCPQLKSGKMNDLSNRVWERKANAWRGIDITLIAPSRWIAGCARESSLFRNSRIEVIPNGLDLRSYKPIDKMHARSLLNLPEDKHLLLFGTPVSLEDRNKGFHFLVSALDKIRHYGWNERMDLVVFGSSHMANREIPGFKVHMLGKLHDDPTLALAYAAADAFIAPSIQENLPNSVLESIACGTPAIAFRIGGMMDLIEHRINGYLAEPFNIDDMAMGIRWIMEDGERHRDLCGCCREKAVREFDVGIQARRYISLFRLLHPDAR